MNVELPRRDLAFPTLWIPITRARSFSKRRPRNRLHERERNASWPSQRKRIWRLFFFFRCCFFIEIEQRVGIIFWSRKCRGSLEQGANRSFQWREHECLLNRIVIRIQLRYLAITRNIDESTRYLRFRRSNPTTSVLFLCEIVPFFIHIHSQCVLLNTIPVNGYCAVCLCFWNE